MKRVLFVGANPSKKNLFENVPFIGSRSGKILAEWIDHLGINNYKVINASDKILEKGEKLGLADYNLERLGKEALDSDIIVALGKDASKACDILLLEHCKLPHPSGLNRQLNDKKAIKNKLDMLMVKIWK